jgi:hypothetical protein
MKNVVLLKTIWRHTAWEKKASCCYNKMKVCVRVGRNRTWNREKILTIHVLINLCTGSQACIMFVNVELIVLSSFSSLLQNFFFSGKFRSTISVGSAENYICPAYWIFFLKKSAVCVVITGKFGFNLFCGLWEKDWNVKRGKWQQWWRQSDDNISHARLVQVSLP